MTTDPPPVSSVEEFATLYTRFLQQMHLSASGTTRLSEIGQLISDELGCDPTGLDVEVEVFQPHQLADVEAALTAVGERHGGRWVGVRGVNRHHVDSLSELLGEGFGEFALGPLTRSRVAVGADRSRSVISFGLLLVTMPTGGLVCLLRAPEPRYGRSMVTLDLLATSNHPTSGDDHGGTAATGSPVDGFMAEVRAQLNRESVLAGQVISFQPNPFDDMGAESPLRFLTRPEVAVSDVVLPDGVLDRISRHVVGIRDHRDALLQARQHLKRGVLLYGPPGTGKTHVVRHLISASPGVTVILLTGKTLELLTLATQLARAAQPAMIVMEDCDLVAEERGGETNSALFETLEAMDGLDGDADVAFVLTTNRPDLLERALVERPGRVDLAVEIAKPDAPARQRLLRLYSPAGAAFPDEVLTVVAARTQGATASFAKELMRRAVLLAAAAKVPVESEHLLAACDEMLSDGETVTRALLGGGQGPDEPVRPAVPPGSAGLAGLGPF